MLVGVCIDTVSPHNLFYISLFDFGGMKTRVDRYNITKTLKSPYWHVENKKDNYTI